MPPDPLAYETLSRPSLARPHYLSSAKAWGGRGAGDWEREYEARGGRWEGGCFSPSPFPSSPARSIFSPRPRPRSLLKCSSSINVFLQRPVAPVLFLIKECEVTSSFCNFRLSSLKIASCQYTKAARMCAKSLTPLKVKIEPFKFQTEMNQH